MPGDSPTESDVRRATEARYTALASEGGSLSCGGALHIAAPRRGETAIDLGCGRGSDVLRAAVLVGDCGVAIGVDSNGAMLAEACARAAVAGAQRAQFVRGDLAAVPLPAGRADLVVSNCAINHAPDKAAVYREIHRLLRPGGRFVVSDVIAEEELPETVSRDPAAWAGCYGGAVPEPDYLDAITRAKFASFHVVRRTAPYERGGVRIRSVTVRGTR